MTTGIGYTHSMFKNNLRIYAEEVDKAEKGGNNNGLIDGKEIKAFKALVKEKTGYDFDFSGLKQSTRKTIGVRKADGSFKYNNTGEIALEYQNNGLNSKTIDALNGKTQGHDVLAGSRKTVDIAYMNVDEFQSSQAEAERQENIVSQKLREQREEKKRVEQKELQERSKSSIEKFFEWLASKFQ